MQIAAFLLAAVLGAGGVLQLAPPAADDATVGMTLTAARYWPAATTVRIADLDTGEVQTRQLSAAEATELRTISIAPGRYRVTFTAARLAAVFRDVTLGPKQTVDLGALSFLTLPRVRGVVRDADGTPLSGAEVRAGTLEAKTDVDGSYELEPPAGQWPEFVTITARGRGARILDFPKSTADAELPPVTLGRPAKVRVTLTERPAGDLNAVLQVRTASEQLAVVRRARLDAPKKSVEFDGLGSGSYVLLIRGEGPLEQFATRIILGAGDDRREEVEIHPLPFTGRVTMGGEPLPRTEIAMRNLTFHWHGDLETDDAGRIAGKLWQPGDYAAEYHGTGTAGSFHQSVTIGRTSPISMNIDVARREVRGRLLDSDGFPVAGARVVLRTDTSDDSSIARAETAMDGTFAFEAVAAGEQHLSVQADGYLIPDKLRFMLHPSDTLREVPIVLASGILRILHIVDDAGHPAVAADVVAVSNGVLRATAYSDQEGRVRIPVADGATVVFILGRNGAFAALRPHSDDVTAVTLPPPGSSLRITTRTTLGQPLPNVAMLVAYGGETLPLEVASRFERAHGSLRTGANGDLTLRNLPAGTYQFWPYASESEAESILASDAPPPITVNVKPGDNAVVVEFQAK
ncbi:MAG TPA: carboxypeptidase-like regulatory domain-containing protein [Thermoanaerobaculia bacterium]|nr:carboxypeptidase-like regulatory domain-containing protein [Thermoanaerobaculia bacterium]